jgi:hypothetical protein
MALGTAGYQRFNWSNLNPNEDEYNWSSIDDAIAQWAQYGKQFGFGVMSVNIHGPKMSTPKWVFDKGAKYTMWNSDSSNNSDEIFYIPVWDDPFYVSACAKFAKALAERYDGNPNIAFIDIRNYGNWGEMHTYPFEKHTVNLKDEQVQSLLIQPYLDNFKQTQLMMCWGQPPLYTTNQWAVDNGIGLRSDGIMGPIHERNTSGEVLAPAFGKEPVIWEFYEYFKKFDVNKTWDDDRFIKNIKAYKPNYIGMGAWGDDAQYMLRQKPKLVREVANLMGYNFSMTDISYISNILIDKTQEISLSIENSGVTNMLTDCVLKFVLLDNNNEIVSSFTTNWNVKNIYGCTVKTFKANVVFLDAPVGVYKLAIGLYRKESDPKPTYNMDNKGRTEDGFFVIGNLQIESN